MEKVVKCKECGKYFGYSKGDTKCKFCHTGYNEAGGKVAEEENMKEKKEVTEEEKIREKKGISTIKRKGTKWKKVAVKKDVETPQKESFKIWSH